MEKERKKDFTEEDWHFDHDSSLYLVTGNGFVCLSLEEMRLLQRTDPNRTKLLPNQVKGLLGPRGEI